MCYFGFLLFFDIMISIVFFGTYYISWVQKRKKRSLTGVKTYFLLGIWYWTYSKNSHFLAIIGFNDKICRKVNNKVHIITYITDMVKESLRNRFYAVKTNRFRLFTN